MREGDSEKPSIDAANLSNPIPLDDPFWTAASFAADREVEMLVRIRARRDSILLRWRSGDTDAQAAGVERLADIRNVLGRERMEAQSEAYSREVERLGEDAKWPSRVEEITRPSVRNQGRLTSADRAANYIGAVGGQLSRIAQIEHKDLRDAIRRPLHLFLYERPVFADRVDAWERYQKAVSDRRKVTEEFGVGPVELVSVLIAVSECEESGEPCEPLDESIATIQKILRAKAIGSSTPKHVRDAYAASVWNAFKVEDGGGFVTIEGDETITRIRYGPRCRYLRLLNVASSVIAAQYGTSTERALAFLLSVSPLGFSIARIDYQTEDRPAALARIVLTVDPTLSPEEVRRLYRHARSRVVAYHLDTEEATMALAGFVYSQTRIRTTPTIDEARSGDYTDFNEGWLQLMAEWNDEQQYRPTPGRKGASKIYTDMARFRRDAEVARSRLLDRKIKVPAASREYPPLEVFEDPEAAPKKAFK